MKLVRNNKNKYPKFRLLCGEFQRIREPEAHPEIWRERQWQNMT